MKSANKIYTQFLGRNSGDQYIVELGDLTELAEIGKVDKIDYIALKNHLDNEKAIYTHKFKKKPVLLSNGKILIIYGDFKLTDRGIE